MKQSLPTIIEAIEGRDLLGAAFQPHRNLFGRKQDSWAAWKSFLRAVFGLPMSDADRELCERCTGRSDLPAGPFSEVHCIVGRRGGKSRIAAACAVYLAGFRDYSSILAPGETGIIPIVAADRRQAEIILGYVVALLETSPVLKNMIASPPLRDSVTLKNKIRIEIFTSSLVSVRGFTLITTIADETAFWRSEESGANPDGQIFSALRPGMATVPGALLLSISSPYARRGELFKNFQAFHGKAGAPVLIWRADSRTMNPTLSRAVVAAAYLRDSASARAEYGGEFRDDVESFLSVELVESAVIPNRTHLPPSSDLTYVAFCDPSGGRADSMTLAIAHCEQEKVVLDFVREIEPPFSPEGAVEEFATVLRGYRVSEVTGDRYAGEWPREQFAKRGIAYRVSERAKSELYLQLLPILTSGRVEILDNRRLTAQLASLERHPARAGRDSVDHGPGAHDDVANAVAGAVVRAMQATGTFGLLELVSSGRMEKLISLFTRTRSPRDELTGKQAAAEFEAKFRGLRRDKTQFPEATRFTICPKCEQAWAEEIAPGRRRCANCGYEFSVAALSEVDTRPKCLKCKSLASPVPGGGLRCQQCGFQFWEPGKEPELCLPPSRNDLPSGLSGALGDRPRAQIPGVGSMGSFRRW